MKIKFLAILVALLLSTAPFSVRATHAVCPGQEITVFFVNGVYAEQSVEDHRKALERLSKDQGVSLDCVHFVALPNHDELFDLDLLEAIEQKSTELAVDFSKGMGMLLRSIIPDTWFLDGVIDQVYSHNGGNVIDADLDEHMIAYRAALAEGQRIILTCHSQGCLYTQEAYYRMTEAERAKARFVTVVTPAAEVPNSGKNTRLYEDALAGLFFAAAILPDIGNSEKCAGNTADRWTCHGMETSYLHGANSRTEIIKNIVASLQTATLKGRVTYNAEPVAGASVSVMRFGGIQNAHTLTDAMGLYTLFPDECLFDPSPGGGCSLYSEASIGGEIKCLRVEHVVLETGATYTRDIELAACGGGGGGGPSAN